MGRGGEKESVTSLILQAMLLCTMCFLAAFSWNCGSQEELKQVPRVNLMTYNFQHVEGSLQFEKLPLLFLERNRQFQSASHLAVFKHLY